MHSPGSSLHESGGYGLSAGALSSAYGNHQNNFAFSSRSFQCPSEFAKESVDKDGPNGINVVDRECCAFDEHKLREKCRDGSVFQNTVSMSLDQCAVTVCTKRLLGSWELHADRTFFGDHVCCKRNSRLHLFNTAMGASAGG